MDAVVKDVRLLVVGPAGQGKSTFLNEIADQMELFPTAAGTSMKTGLSDAVNMQSKQLMLGESLPYKVMLIDTPAFPLPDAEMSKRHLAYIAEKFAGSLHGVVLILNPERKGADALRQALESWRDLFVALRANLFVVGNGFESGKRGKVESDDHFSNRQKNGEDSFQATIADLVREYRLPVAPEDIHISFCLDDLADHGKAIVQRCGNLEPRCSPCPLLTSSSSPTTEATPLVKPDEPARNELANNRKSYWPWLVGGGILVIVGGLICCWLYSRHSDIIAKRAHAKRAHERLLRGQHHIRVEIDETQRKIGDSGRLQDEAKELLGDLTAKKDASLAEYIRRTKATEESITERRRTRIRRLDSLQILQTFQILQKAILNILDPQHLR